MIRIGRKAISFVTAQYAFLTIEMFLFPLKEEFINLRKRSLRNEMYKFHF